MNKISTLAKSLIPHSVRSAIRPFNNWIRSKLRIAKRIGMKKLSIQHLKSDLLSIGINEGDAIMVHSSLSSIGNVEGGAETIVKSLLDTVTSSGTLMMPCYSSAEDIQSGMTEGRFVDLRKLKSEMGKITEVFRTWPEVVRSSHPFSSVCAWGHAAKHMTSGHASNPYICHAESPMGRIIENNVKIVGIGVTITVGMAVSHNLEDTDEPFPIEVHAPPFQVKYIDAAGNSVSREVIRFDPVVSATRIGLPGTEWICEMLTKHFTKLGIMQHFRFGNADSWVMDAKTVFGELKRLAQKGITIYLTEDEWKSMNSGDKSINSW